MGNETARGEYVRHGRHEEAILLYWRYQTAEEIRHDGDRNERDQTKMMSMEIWTCSMFYSQKYFTSDGGNKCFRISQVWLKPPRVTSETTRWKLNGIDMSRQLDSSRGRCALNKCARRRVYSYYCFPPQVPSVDVGTYVAHVSCDERLFPYHDAAALLMGCFTTMCCAKDTFLHAEQDGRHAQRNEGLKGRDRRVHT